MKAEVGNPARVVDSASLGALQEIGLGPNAQIPQRRSVWHNQWLDIPSLRQQEWIYNKMQESV